MRENPPRPYDPAIAIITDDGTAIRCRRIAFPRSPGVAMTELRWVFTGEDGRDHIGPPAVLAKTPGELQLMVEEWWGTKKTLRQA